MSEHTDKNAVQQKARKLSPLAYIFVGFVRFYQYFISPLLGANCRYQPTCSAYAYDAIVRLGAMKGGWLALKRIGKCHPWGGFGYDPVPQSVSHTCGAEKTLASGTNNTVYKSTVSRSHADDSLGVKSDG